ncbi:hypothetical protein, membrane [Rhodopirellula maiorica SM1]|uniref:Uncharacterized protein n=1 Tax=Rhodopirellula maiorica SM1 TaxID=1265738 RepID=M5RIJ6_9BACT|nr:hypothetical protein [Rhodopirellula maiorica]EMI19125.1 hypothetical protein, membrane [Rhodopirellula maiorica SM1]
MKIPSQFNEDSLYGRRQRRGATVQDYRRVIRLALGLALVLVVMRQAAKPRVYEPFFGGAAGQQQRLSNATRQIYAGNRPADLLIGGDATAETVLDLREVDPKVMLDARAIVALVPPEDQQLWLATLLRIRRHQEIPQFTVLDTGWTVKLSQLDWQADQESDEKAPQQGWSELIQRVASDPSGLSAEMEDTGGDAKIKIQALIRALDTAAASRVAASGVWQSRDRDAMYRYLDEAQFGFENDWAGLTTAGLTTAGRATEGTDASAEEASGLQKTGKVQATAAPAVPQVGVLPLMQQPDVYLNHVVAFAGRPARVERHAANSNEYGIAHYWHLWLRPVDGADRPLLAVVNDVPESIANGVFENSESEDAAVLWITGRFLKRLAYRSGAGADSAPVIVGRILTLPPDAETESATQSNSLVSDDGMSRSLWGMILFAVLLGVGLAALAMWRTAVSARQSRQLRHAKDREPSPFLAHLEPNHGDPSHPQAGEDIHPPRESS